MIFVPPKLMKAVPNPMFVAFTATGTDGSSLTSAGASLGAAHVNRRIYIGLGWKSAADRTISSMTVAGNAATIIAQTSASGAGAALCSIALASGTTGDLVVNLSGTALRMGFGVFVSYGHATTATDTAVASAGASNDVSVDVPLGGLIVAAAYNGLTTATWAGVTEHYDDVAEGSTRASGGLYVAGAAETPRTITMTPSSGTDCAVVAASFARL